MLEKLSSPDQLDRAIVIISPSFWVAMLGGGVIILVALLWSIFGRLPENVSTDGIYMNREGMHTVYAETSGIVTEVNVAEGEEIERGDVIAVLSSEALREQMNLLEERKASVEAVTIDSVGDVATADNKALIDLKAQSLTLDSNLMSNELLLATRQRQLAAQKEETKKALKTMTDLQKQYYGTLVSNNTNEESISYQEAQTELANAKGYLESAKSALQSLDAQYATAKDTYDQAKQYYEEVKGYYESVSDGDVSTLISAQQNLAQAESSYNAYQKTRESYVDSVNTWKSAVEKAQEAYDSAQSSYVGVTNNAGTVQASSSRLGTAYQEALSDYNTQLSLERNLEDAVLQLSVQTEAEDINMKTQRELFEKQFEAAKQATLAQIDVEMNNCRSEIDKTNIRSTLSGTVSGLSLVEGSAVTQGSGICRVTQGETDDNVVVFYVPVADGRKLKEGMRVVVCPTTVNKQEYGHMEGKIIQVDSYVTSMEDMRNRLGDDTLVQGFQQNGAVVSVICELEKDGDTASGYWWSNRKGRTVELTEGTFITGDVVVAEKAPITMLIPFLKEKLTVQSADSGQ